MRRSFLLFFLLLTLTGESQLIDSFVHDIKENCRSYKKLNRVFSQYRRYHNIEAVEIWFHYPSFATKAVTYEMSDITFSFPAVHLDVFYKKDKIVFLRLVDYKDTVFTYIDTIFASKVLKKKNRGSDILFTVKDMYQTGGYYFSTFHSQDIILGTSPSKEMNKTIESVEKKDSLFIIKYARSFFPGLRAYGAIGLYLWSKEVAPLDKEAQELLSFIQSSKKKMNIARGCIVQQETISDATSQYALDQIYAEYVDYKKKLSKRTPRN